MPNIHPSAHVDAQAELADDVVIGPQSVIGPHVRIGAGTQVGPHCVIEGHTDIGEDNRFVAFCSIGGIPQDKKYQGEPTRLSIGARNTFREFCTVHIGTVQDEGLTSIGDDNWLMTYVHIAHDCRIGNNTILSSSAQLAGHARVDDWAILSGFCGVHQFVRIGAHAMAGGQALVLQDIPPFVLAAGSPAKPSGINVEGLKRRGYSSEAIRALRHAYRLLYRSELSLADAIAAITAQQAETSDDKALTGLASLVDFLSAKGRGIVR